MKTRFNFGIIEPNICTFLSVVCLYDDGTTEANVKGLLSSKKRITDETSLTGRKGQKLFFYELCFS